MADLSGKVAVVTGGSRGVGKGIAEGLAEAGATVYVTGRSESTGNPPAPRTIQATARRVDELGGRGIAVCVDHQRDDQVAALFERVRREQGRLDVLVNNACRIPEPPAWGGVFWEQPVVVWDDQCGLGLRGYYVAAVHAAPLMVTRGRGLIVNVSSAAGEHPAVGTAYEVCKAGVDRMARHMAAQLEPHGVAALALWPGAVKTERILNAAAAGTLKLDLEQAHAPRFVGRCIAALAMDPDVMEKSGGVYRVAELAREYRFSDPDRSEF
jgi:NAD(P)-dependent dehydrogenase (short-subunit alcohol dehydrogenase family)